MLRPDEPLFLGGSGSFDNRVYVNGAIYYTLNEWLVTDEWFFYSFILEEGLENFNSIPFPREKVSNETDYFFHGAPNNYRKNLDVIA